MGNFNNNDERREEIKEVKEIKRTRLFVDGYGQVYEIPEGHVYDVDPDKFGDRD